MFARHISVQLEFTRTIEQDIVALLRQRKGFQGEITLVVRGGTEAIRISLWDRKEDAEASRSCCITSLSC